MWSSTRRLAGLQAEPSSPRARSRLAPERDEQLVALDTSAVLERDGHSPSPRCRPRGLLPGADVDPARLSASVPARRRTPPRGRAAAGAPSISVTARRARYAWASSTPTRRRPAPRAARGPPWRWWPRGSSTASTPRGPGSAASRRRAGGEQDGAAAPRDLVADRDAPLAREPAVAADELDAPLLEPRQLRGVVEVVDDLVAPVERRRDVELTGDRLRGARDPPRLGQRLVRAAAAPSTACSA